MSDSSGANSQDPAKPARAKRKSNKSPAPPPAPSPMMQAFHARRDRAQELLGRAGVIGVESAVYVPPLPPLMWERISEQANAEGAVWAIDFEALQPLLVVRLDVAEAWLGLGKAKEVQP